MAGPRIALLGFSIECNRFAPPATLRDFETRCLIAGDTIVADARSAAPAALGEMPGFVTAMDASGAWEAGRKEQGKGQKKGGALNVPVRHTQAAPDHSP